MMDYDIKIYRRRTSLTPVKKLLNYCIEQNKAKNIELVLITNGTLLNQEWIDIFAHSKYFQNNF